jgi:hypothetical protein
MAIYAWDIQSFLRGWLHLSTCVQINRRDAETQSVGYQILRVSAPLRLTRIILALLLNDAKKTILFYFAFLSRSFGHFPQVGYQKILEL